jgi:hypothetical protein
MCRACSRIAGGEVPPFLGSRGVDGDNVIDDTTADRRDEAVRLAWQLARRQRLLDS